MMTKSLGGRLTAVDSGLGQRRKSADDRCEDRYGRTNCEINRGLRGFKDENKGADALTVFSLRSRTSLAVLSCSVGRAFKNGRFCG